MHSQFLSYVSSLSMLSLFVGWIVRFARLRCSADRSVGPFGWFICFLSPFFMLFSH